MLTLLCGFVYEAHAHKPSMLLTDNDDGTFSVAVVESPGSVAVTLESRAGDEVLWRSALNKRGRVVCPKFDQPYTLIVRAGHGGPLTCDGPALRREHRDAEARRDALKSQSEPAEEGTAREHHGHADAHDHGHDHEHHHSHDPEYVAWAPPFASSVDAEMRELLKPLSVSLKNELGMVRRTDIMQCYRYHAQPHMDDILHLAEEAKARDKRVELVTANAGLCFGVTSAFLATDFAIRELYGNEIPSTKDFSITSEAKMDGVWDALNLLFGRELSKADATKSHSPDALVFTAVRRDKNERIVFGYAQTYRDRIKHFFDAKKNPKKYPKGKVKRVKRSLTRDLLKRRADGDFGYFVSVDEGKQ